MSSETNAEYYAQWLNDLSLTGQAAEVGVFRGRFSLAFLTHWKGDMLHLVDPWAGKAGPGMHGGDAQLAEVQEILTPFANRRTIHRMPSVEAAALIEDNSLDFVYIDGDHRYEAVVADLAAWWPKLRVNGVYAGHDFRKNCGVPRAVREFCRPRGIEPRIMPEVDCPKPNALWHFTKDKP